MYHRCTLVCTQKRQEESKQLNGTGVRPRVPRAGTPGSDPCPSFDGKSHNVVAELPEDIKKQLDEYLFRKRKE